MKKSKESSAIFKGRRSISLFLGEHKSGRFNLNCAHRAMKSHGRSNTILIRSDGKALCLECGF